MKILLSHKLEGITGGATFQQNLEKGMRRYYPDVELIDDIKREDYDVLFIVTPTSIADFNFIDRAKELGKRIVVRFDNMPKAHRNRRYRVFTKMKRLAEIADQVIYQSQWAKDYIAWGEIPSKGKVIHNAVDLDLFNKTGKSRDFRNGEKVKEIYLVMISSSDPCKRLHEALDIFSEKHKLRTLSGDLLPKLIIAGRLPDEYHVRKMEANWDFVRGEKVQYIGEIHSQKEVAEVMKGCTCLVHPSYKDACSNTILEARACGLQIIASLTGGTPEVMAIPEYKMGLQYMCSKYMEVFENKKW